MASSTVPTAKIDRSTCQAIAAEAMAALEAVAARHGLTVSQERGTFDPANFTFKAKFTAQTANGAPADFARNAQALGLPPGCYGTEIRHNGNRVKIVGFELRRRKYPVLVELEDGAKRLITLDGARGGLALAS